MVRCRKCTKSFRQKRSWIDGVCYKCQHKEPEFADYRPEKINTRTINTAVDMYLDQYVWYELFHIDN